MTILILSVIVLSIVLVIAGYTYRTAFYAPKSKRSSIDDPLEGPQYEVFQEHISRISHIMERIPCEPVTITSFDGCKLYGRYYHVNDDAPLEILFHGYRSCAFRDCSGGHALSRKMGFNALVVDQRAHGKSGGHTISFGLKERYDVLSWVNYANRRFGTDTKILLYGLSMGSATVIMASGLNLPKNVVGIVADCPYSSPVDIIKKVIKDMRLPPMVLYPFVFLGALIFGRLNLEETTCEKEVKKSRTPILIFHGEDDRFVPDEMSKIIYEANKDMVTRESFKDAGHGLSFIKDPLRYKKALIEFWEKVLK